MRFKWVNYKDQQYLLVHVRINNIAVNGITRQASLLPAQLSDFNTLTIIPLLMFQKY